MAYPGYSHVVRISQMQAVPKAWPLFSICRLGGIGRRKGLKIPRGQLRIGSSPIAGSLKSPVFTGLLKFRVHFREH